MFRKSGPQYYHISTANFHDPTILNHEGNRKIIYMYGIQGNQCKKARIHNPCGKLKAKSICPNRNL